MDAMEIEYCLKTLTPMWEELKSYLPVCASETETFYQQSCIVRGGKNAVGVRGRHGSGTCLQRPLMITKNLLHNFQTFQGVRTMSQTIGLSSILPFFAILKSKFSKRQSQSISWVLTLKAELHPFDNQFNKIENTLWSLPKNGKYELYKLQINWYYW